LLTVDIFKKSYEVSSLYYIELFVIFISFSSRYTFTSFQMHRRYNGCFPSGAQQTKMNLNEQKWIRFVRVKSRF